MKNSIFIQIFRRTIKIYNIAYFAATEQPQRAGVLLIVVRAVCTHTHISPK